MVLYIHGFGGSGQGVKAKLFREYFVNNGEPFLAPSLSYVPELAIYTLEEMIEQYDGKISLIGSSLGGYYALYLAHKYKLRTALINPSIYPYKTLSAYSGNALNFYDCSHFEFTDTHLQMLKNYEVSGVDETLFLLMVQKGDDLLDYKEATKKLSGVKTILEEGGSHSFEGIENHFKGIKNFFDTSS